ncbi:DUF5621 domain-containing protein [Legionella bononiensis]|uniref:DUF5621 domain-containing protein n=1 Tax=Legionella bononiensis TaxID=2793102 RepID=A0ABS1WE28_9GAMM|nr:DUF5621 domain-containing protein [Legionella bononiensis]MBL7479519.1 DUF5621 domain-containing protein [Legionella bononiensis]MBL7527607.1 DUF5621 domain-containing protein [Legionella bononiensis]
MATFTVFCYGTGETHQAANNIISQFSKACSQEHSIHVDGPTLLGTEVKANAKRATDQIIKWLSTQQDDSHNINLTGFSRGSVTSLHIANNLKRQEKALAAKEQRLLRAGKELNNSDKQLLTQLQKINLNLFLMDPVAGLSDKSNMDGRVIPDNVKNYVAVLQMDEMRRDFKPQDMTRIIVQSPQTTKVSMLPMYGNHSDTTKIKNDQMTAGPKIAWYSLHQFLTQHGTKFNNDQIPQIVYSQNYKNPVDLPQNPSAKELLELFSVNHEERDAYLKSGKKSNLTDGIPVPRVQRTLNNHLDFYVKNPDFFTNQLERELFKITYPKTFNYLFERNQFDIRFPENSNSTPEQVEIELNSLKRDNSKLFERLKPRGVQEVNGIITVGPSGGLYHLEPCGTVVQMFPNLVTNDLIYQKTPNKLAVLEMNAYRHIFRYQREKPIVYFSGERPEDLRATKLIKEINLLVNDKKLSDDEKYHSVLDLVEKHYKEMAQQASTSDLASMLGKLLDSYGRQYTIQDPGIVRMLLSGIVHATMNLLKEVISFVGNLGYLGGTVLFAIGHAVQDIGRRLNDMLGPLGYNPLKYVASAIAYTMEGIGFAIKNSFGLKPLTDFITSGLNGIRDALNKAILDIKIERANAAANNDTVNPMATETQTLWTQNESDLPKHKAEELREPLLSKHDESPSDIQATAINKTKDARRAMQEQRSAFLSKEKQKDDELSHEGDSSFQIS